MRTDCGALGIMFPMVGGRTRVTASYQAPSRAAERWRAIKVTDFERRQMDNLGKELDHEYEDRNGLANPASQKPSQTKIPSKNRT